MAWSLRGDYLEDCNCEVLCPCLLGPRNERGGALARPTEGHCDLLAVFHVIQGAMDRVVLDGMNAVMTIYTPGPMGDGNWTLGLYLDDRANAEQRAALSSIFRGEAGGVPARLAGLIAKRLEPRVVPINFSMEGRVRKAAIPGVMALEVEGLLGGDGKTEVWLQNIRHFACRMMAAARGTVATYRDRGVDWNNTGRNAHYGSFEWSA